MIGGSFKDRFPSLGELCYLNAAGEGPLPARSAAALARASGEKERPESLGVAHYCELPNAVRRQVARLINAAPEEVALTGSTSAGIGIAARELPIPPGGEILLLEGQFPANVFPWAAATRRGCVVRRVPLSRGGSPLEALQRAAGPRTAAVSIDWVGFASGVRAEIGAIGELCRSRGVIFVLDAAQCVGALSLDVRAVGADVVAAPGHKWLLGPQGTGFLYVASRWLDRMHPYNAGWINLAAAAGFRELQSLSGEPPGDATRFECGTPPILLLAAWRESLDLILSIGAEEMENRVMLLASALRDAAREAGLEVLSPEGGPHSSPIVVASAGEATPRVCRALGAAGVVTALREGAIRISPHIYNDASDVAHFELEAARALESARMSAAAATDPWEEIHHRSERLEGRAPRARDSRAERELDD